MMATKVAYCHVGDTKLLEWLTSNPVKPEERLRNQALTLGKDTTLRAWPRVKFDSE